jgi:hypothetical protein
VFDFKKKISMHDKAGIEADKMIFGTIDDTDKRHTPPRKS